MSQKPIYERDVRFGRAYVTALRLQHELELANMPTQAAQAREIRRQVHVRLLALAANAERPT